MIGVLGKKWTFEILQAVEMHENKGFNFMTSRINGITAKILSLRLQQLEKIVIIEKGTGIGHTFYRLTPKGKELLNILRDMKDWHCKYLSREDSCRDKECVTCENYSNA